jgi:predicted alpha/beta-hydrolase family hydrolase
MEIETPHGPARAHVHAVPDAKAALVIGHGAAGGIGAKDIVAVSAEAQALGVSVALVEQPYLVAGRKAPAPAAQLDAAFTAVVEHLVARELRGLPLVAGGRSLSARVACRTSDATGAIAVLCLAFPVHPPGKDDPEHNRLPELEAVRVPTLVVQGENDPFGMPPPGPNREVARVAGDHGLKKDLDAVVAAVRDWLPRVVG